MFSGASKFLLRFAIQAESVHWQVGAPHTMPVSYTHLGAVFVHIPAFYHVAVFIVTHPLAAVGFLINVPVSYTHLDVYKRQQLDHAVEELDLLGVGLQGNDGLLGSGSVTSMHALAAVTAADADGCLLYTSTRAMKAERFGSYSRVLTVAGTPNLLRLKSITRYLVRLPPP